MFGKPWHAFEKLERDEEKKVTIFDYENFFPEGFLKCYDTESEEFKEIIKKLNYYSFTEYEAHQENKKYFSKLMPFMA